jgi:hypothetical protein
VGDLNILVIRPKLYAADVAKLNIQLYKFIFMEEILRAPNEEPQGEKEDQDSGQEPNRDFKHQVGMTLDVNMQ